MQLGLGAGTFDTTIRFEGDRDVDVEMSSVSVSGTWLVNDRWSVRAAGGILLDGKLDPGHGLTRLLTEAIEAGAPVTAIIAATLGLLTESACLGYRPTGLPR